MAGEPALHQHERCRMTYANSNAPARFEGQALGRKSPKPIERISMRKIRNGALVRNHWDLPLWQSVTLRSRSLTYPERSLARRHALGSRSRARLVAGLIGYRTMEGE